jgi:hypothetical protein
MIMLHPPLLFDGEGYWAVSYAARPDIERPGDCVWIVPGTLDPEE